jgi:Mrp family chromosome partitioning ATPase
MIVDGVVLVTLAGKSSIYLTRRFKQRLGSIGARIYGVVLNGIKSNSLEYSYYGYAYNYYTPSKDDLDDTTPWLEDDVVFNSDEEKNGQGKK